MPLFEALQYSPGLLVATVTALGLLVGSFLNVVILRLPLMMEQDWKRECREILADELAPRKTPAVEERISLYHPPSRCPSCGARVKAWQNIPVISWLLLRGKCAGCAKPISMQYPLVEAAAGLLSLVCALHFGYGPQLAWALVLTWALIALTMIDARTMLLPDAITLPLLWLGLLLAFWGVFAPLPSAVAGAMAGYMSLWTIYQLFKLVTGKEGMGYGDFKLFAALGAWLGAQDLLLIILLSSIVGSVVGVVLIVLQRRGMDVQLPFGPYLAGAGWIALIWGEQLKQAYFAASGTH